MKAPKEIFSMPSLPNLAKRAISSFYEINKNDIHKLLNKKYGPTRTQAIFVDIGQEYFNVFMKDKMTDLEIRCKALVLQTESFQQQISTMSKQEDEAAEVIKSLTAQLDMKTQEIEKLKVNNNSVTLVNPFSTNDTVAKCLDRSSLDHAAKDIKLFHGQEKESDAADAAVKLIIFIEQLNETLQIYQLNDNEKLRILKRRITGDAEAVIAYAKPSSYIDALECLKERYLDENRCGEALINSLRSMYRRTNEPVLSFAVRLGTIASALSEINKEDINTPSSFRNLSNILLRSFKEEIRGNYHVEQALHDRDYNSLMIAVDRAVISQPSLGKPEKANMLTLKLSNYQNHTPDNREQEENFVDASPTESFLMKDNPNKRVYDEFLTKRNDIANLQRKDEYFSTIFQEVLNGNNPKFKDFNIRNKILFYKDRICVPQACIMHALDCINATIENGNKIVDQIEARSNVFYWHKMGKDFKLYFRINRLKI